MDEWSDVFGLTRLIDVKNQVEANADAEEIILHINSPGGDVQEGFGIHDFLVNSGKKITTVIEARCYSIATVIALAGSTRKMAKNAEFMIHNPWGGAMGTADDLQKAADWIRKAEDQLATFYVEKTGADEQTIRDMMKNETFMPSNQALEMKFITDVMEPVKAFAFVPKNNNDKIIIDMNGDKKTIKAQISDLWKKFGFGKDPFAAKKALDLTIANGDNAGKTLHLETEASEAKVGDVATIDGAAAPDSTYEVDGGVKITTAEGKVSAVENPSDANASDSDEVKALKAELKKAQDEAAALKAEKAENDAINAAMVETLDKLSKVKSNFTPPKNTNTIDPPKPGKYNADEFKEKAGKFQGRKPIVAE